MSKAPHPVTRLALIALLVILGIIEATLVHLWNPGRRIAALQIAYAIVTAAIILYLARAPRQTTRQTTRPTPRITPAAVIAGSFVLTVLIAQFALEAYPSSGDEYGYNFVADTLAHGRLWNLAYPDPLRDVLASFYIGGHGDQRLSQYIPGWPALLLPFKLIGIPQFANAFIGLAAGLFLFAALRRLAVPPAIRLAALILGVTAPFVIFNDASYFSHSLTAAAILGIIWLDLRDAAHPSALNRLGIGFGFSVLLTTRFETFLIGILLFAVDGLIRHRLRFIRWAIPAAIGGLPLAVLLLLYNWQITGSPFTTTLTWVSPGTGFGLHASGVDGPHSLTRGLVHTATWFADWQDFASVLLLPFYVVALWRRVATRTLRWFDLLWPATVFFFVFYPDDGGYQYGPRYWFFAHAPMPITIAAGMPILDDAWHFFRLRLDPVRLALIQLASFVGFALGFAFFLHLQVENRLIPPRVAATIAPPAVVIMQDQDRYYVPWQRQPYEMLAKDYTRNGVGPLGPLVMAIDLGPARTERLCQQFADRPVYRIRFDPAVPRGTLEPVCNGATATAPNSAP